MKKKLVKISLIILNIILILSLFSNVFSASVVKSFSGNVDKAKDGKDAIVTILSSVLGVVRTIGAAVAVIILIVIACKYIIASAGDRADIKKYAINYIIGALVLFGASGIASLIKSFVDASVKFGS